MELTEWGIPRSVLFGRLILVVIQYLGLRSTDMIYTDEGYFISVRATDYIMLVNDVITIKYYSITK
jgi:hypothetical protein